MFLSLFFFNFCCCWIEIMEFLFKIISFKSVMSFFVVVVEFLGLYKFILSKEYKFKWFLSSYIILVVVLWFTFKLGKNNSCCF